MFTPLLGAFIPVLTAADGDSICLLLKLFCCVLFFLADAAAGATSVGSMFCIIGGGAGAGGFGGGGGGAAGGRGGGAGTGLGASILGPPPKHIVIHPVWCATTQQLNAVLLCT